jgi:sec-independent protein translocase protein TatB
VVFGLEIATIAAIWFRHYDEAMSFSETIFLFLLALIIFGPKKLPEIARQAGRILAELRRASNEFKSQIETEIAHLEVEKNRPVMAPTQPPAGTVASLSLNPAVPESIPAKSEPEATLAAPVATVTEEKPSIPAAEVDAQNSDPPAQVSHV